MNQSDAQYHRIVFRLEKDDDDYPPSEFESLWATEEPNGLYQIDNIPFFVCGISPGDLVRTVDDGGNLFFDQLITPSGSSVLRVVVFDVGRVQHLRERLGALGCETEASHIPNLISVEVPGDVNYDEVISFLDGGENRQHWEYETASIRQ